MSGPWELNKAQWLETVSQGPYVKCSLTLLAVFVDLVLYDCSV